MIYYVALDVTWKVALTCSNLVELRGFEPLTYSMRTSRATNCAIAPDTGSTGYQPPSGRRKSAELLARCAWHVEIARERGVVKMLEDRVLVVDLQHH